LFVITGSVQSPYTVFVIETSMSFHTAETTNMDLFVANTGVKLY